MKKTEKLSRWLLILIVFEVLLLLYCLFFAREILIEEGLFFVLGLFSAIVLSDLLLTWTIPWDCLFSGGCRLYPISSSLALAL